MRAKLLIVEDDPTLRAFLTEVGRGIGAHTIAEARGDNALSRIQSEHFDLILSDVRLPGCGGIDLLKAARERNPAVRVIMMTAFATVDLAIEAMKAGAGDFLQKPFTAEVAEGALKSAIEKIELERDIVVLRRELPEGMVGESEEFLRVISAVDRVAQSEANVLIEGETGVGKELVAREIHRRGPRAAKRLVTVHVPAIPDTLIEAELFGHERGAFTGAVKDRAGLLELADGGTLFLDEIGDLTPAMQVKILRFLQERTFRRVGSNEEMAVDVRLIAATNRNLAREVAEGRFREDLFYRLNVVPITVPPLRERKDDIPLLIGHFLSKYAGNRITKVAVAVMKKYRDHLWPGNIRELESVVARASALTEGTEIRETFLTLAAKSDPDGLLREGFSLPDHVAEVERSIIRKALEMENGVKSRAASRLGLNRTTLIEKMARWGL